MLKKITVTFDAERQQVTSIEGADFQNPGMVAAVLGLAVEECKFMAGLARIQAQQSQAAQAQLAARFSADADLRKIRTG